MINAASSSHSISKKKVMEQVNRFLIKESHSFILPFLRQVQDGYPDLLWARSGINGRWASGLAALYVFALCRRSSGSPRRSVEANPGRLSEALSYFVPQGSPGIWARVVHHRLRGALESCGRLDGQTCHASEMWFSFGRGCQEHASRSASGHRGFFGQRQGHLPVSAHEAQIRRHGFAPVHQRDKTLCVLTADYANLFSNSFQSWVESVSRVTVTCALLLTGGSPREPGAKNYCNAFWVCVCSDGLGSADPVPLWVLQICSAERFGHQTHGCQACISRRTRWVLSCFSPASYHDQPQVCRDIELEQRAAGRATPPGPPRVPTRVSGSQRSSCGFERTGSVQGTRQLWHMEERVQNIGNHHPWFEADDICSATFGFFVMVLPCSIFLCCLLIEHAWCRLWPEHLGLCAWHLAFGPSGACLVNRFWTALSGQPQFLGVCCGGNSAAS